MFAQDNSFGGPNLTFNSGDTYEIYKLLVALDQPGRGKGDLLTDHESGRDGVLAAPGIGASLRLGQYLQSLATTRRRKPLSDDPGESRILQSKDAI